MTLAQLLDRAARRRPEMPAVVDGARRLTYGDLAREAAAVGRGLARLGVAKGDRVVALRDARAAVQHVLDRKNRGKVLLVP